MNKNRSPSEFDATLIDSVDRLRAELSVLRQVLDEIRDELEWANQNRDEAVSVPVGLCRLTSMPRDPCASDWAERLNRFSAADVADQPTQPTPKEQGQLF